MDYDRHFKVDNIMVLDMVIIKTIMDGNQAMATAKDVMYVKVNYVVDVILEVTVIDSFKDEAITITYVAFVVLDDASPQIVVNDETYDL